MIETRAAFGFEMMAVCALAKQQMNQGSALMASKPAFSCAQRSGHIDHRIAAIRQEFRRLEWRHFSTLQTIRNCCDCCSSEVMIAISESEKKYRFLNSVTRRT